MANFKVVDKVTMNFPCGSNDWKIWSRITDYLSNFFGKKRKSLFATTFLRQDYQIYLEIRSRRNKKKRDDNG